MNDEDVAGFRRWAKDAGFTLTRVTPARNTPYLKLVCTRCKLRLAFTGNHLHPSTYLTLLNHSRSHDAEPDPAA